MTTVPFLGDVALHGLRESQNWWLDNMADGTSLTCTSQDNSQIGDCSNGFYVDETESYDICAQCSSIDNTLDARAQWQ